MTDRNLYTRISLQGGDEVKRDLNAIGESGQKAIEKIQDVTVATSKGITDIDRAVASAASAFSRTTKAAETYHAASQQLAESHKQGMLSAEQYQGTMAELDKKFRQASAAAKLVEAANNAAKNSQSASSKAVAEATEAYHKLQQTTDTYHTASKSLEDAYRSGTLSAKEYKGVLAQLNSTFGQGTSSVISFSSAFRFTAAIVGVGSLAAIVNQLKDKVVNSSSEMQNMEARLKAITGGSAQASEAMAFLQDMAQRQNIGLGRLVDSYGRLKPSVDNGIISMGEMRNLMALTNDAMMKFGLTTSQQEALMYGLSQVMGSANVTMEDLKQFTDQMPGSFSKLEKAMGQASGGLKDLISKGETTSADIFPAIIKMLKESEGAAESMGSTFSATSTDMATAATNAAAKFGEQSGIVASLTYNMRLLTQVMNDYVGSLAGLSRGELEARLKETGGQLVRQQELVMRLAESYKNANAFEKQFIGDDRDKAMEKFASLSKAYDKIRDSLGYGTTKAEENSKAVNNNAKSFIDLGKNIDDIVKKYAQAGDHFGKSAQQLALESIALYKTDAGYKTLSESKKKEIEATEAQLKKAIALEAAHKSGVAASKNNSNALEEYIAKLREETKESGESARQGEISKAIWEAQNIAKREHITLSKANIAVITEETGRKYDNTEASKKQKQAEHDLAEAIQKAAEKRQEEAKKAQEEFEKPFKDAGEHIQTAFADTFTNIFETGTLNFKDLADNAKHIMLKMAAEVAAAMLFKPMIQPVISGAMGGFSATSGGLSSLGSLGGSAVSSINSFGTSYGFGSGLEAARPAAASSLVGPMLPGMSNSFVGPMPVAQGSMFGATTLMGALGAAGMGATIGSMNLFGGNSTGSTIGGTLGGMAGSYFGPLGSLAGSAIGSGIGGLFGPGSKVSASEFAGTIGANDNLGSLTYGAKNGDLKQAKGLSDAVGTFLSGLVTEGIDIANGDVRGAINSKSGNRFEALGQRFEFDPQDTESVALAVAQLSVELAKAGNNTGSLGTALQHLQTDGRKAEDILADLDFAAKFDKLGEAPAKIGQYEQAALTLNAQFDSAKEKTERLGLSLDKLAGLKQEQVNAFFDSLLVLPENLSPLQQQLKTLAEQFTDASKAAATLGYSQATVTAAQKNAVLSMQNDFSGTLAGEILKITDPVAAQIAEENSRYQAQLSDAKALGVSLTQVEQLHYLKMKELASQAGYFQQQLLANDNDIRKTMADAIQQEADKAKELANRYKAVGEAISKTLSDLSYGSLSPLTTMQKKDEAEALINSLTNSARLGNIDAQEQMAEAVKTYLEFDRELQGSGGTYAEDFARMQGLLKDTAENASRQVPIQERIYNANTEQLTKLQEISNNTGGLGSAISSLSQSLLNGYFNGQSNGGLFSDANLLPKGKEASYLDSMTAQGVTVRQYHTFGRQAGYTGEYGLGGFDAWAKANPDKAAVFNQMLAASGGSPRQFAGGGVTPENQLFSVGERGPELMFAGSRSTVFSAEQSRKLLNSSGAESSEFIQTVRALIEKMDTLIKITAASGDMNNEGLSSISTRLQVIENKARLEAAA